MGDTIEVEIGDIGARGDGIAISDGVKYYVPFAAPGDIARISKPDDRGKSAIIELISPGPERATPDCRHFGACGGCALQHITPTAYGLWKQALVETALRHRGFDDVMVDEPIIVAPGSRRRAMLKFRGTKAGGTLGFNAAGSATIVDLTACPVVDARIEALFDPLRVFLAGIIGNAAAKITLTATETGIDMMIGAGSDPDIETLERLAAFASKQDLARVSWLAGDVRAGPETIVERRQPIIHFGATAISPPAGGFLQSTEAGEAALRDRIIESLGDRPMKVLDLFSGCGAFALPMAERYPVHAVDADANMLTALSLAHRHAGGLKSLTTERRDLYRRPLSADELKGYDAIIFDPPRAGAREQAGQIANSEVPLAIGISCNPATFARDARILANGGYRLDRVTPIDQFLWSAHVELIGVFRAA